MQDLNQIERSKVGEFDEINGNILLPSSLNRRNLLARGAALATASRIGLIGAGIFGATSANANTYQYVTTTTNNTGTYTGVDGVSYKWQKITGKKVSGTYDDWVRVALNNSTTTNWWGYKSVRGQGNVDWASGIHFKNNAATWTPLENDTSASNWVDTVSHGRRAIDINWQLPANAQVIGYLDLDPNDSGMQVFHAVDYVWNNVYYLKYFYSERRLGGWVDVAMSTISGSDRTALKNAVVDWQTTVHNVNVAFGVVAAGVVVGAAGVLIGGIVDAVVDTTTVNKWYVATGVATAILAGVSVAAASSVASRAAVSAGLKMMTLAQQYYNGG